MIVSCVTDGIIVTAQPLYIEKHSNPGASEFVFGYHIRIENESSYTVKLMRRYWNIFDVIGLFKEVKGDGVIGQQPVLAPGESHEYDSWVALQSKMGYMEGHYELDRLEDQKSFLVRIPRFELIVPCLLN